MIKHVASIHFRLATDTLGFTALFSLDDYRSLVKFLGEENIAAPRMEKRGGATLSVVLNTETDTYHIGISVCNPEEWYNKRLGIAESTKRATKAAQRHKKFGKMPNLKDDYVVKPFLLQILQSVPARYLTDDKTLPISSNF